MSAVFKIRKKTRERVGRVIYATVQTMPAHEVWEAINQPVSRELNFHYWLDNYMLNLIETLHARRP